jgi:hypothetical protein
MQRLCNIRCQKIMKWIFFILSGFLFLTACHKNKCNSATITQTGTPCSVWGIKVGTDIYLVDSIPDNFKREGVIVCLDYELYSDMRMCPCCGGTWARIKSIRYPDE